MTGYLYDEMFLAHDAGESHPESPGRLKAIHRRISGAPYFPNLKPIRTEAASTEDVALVHNMEYIGLVERECAAGRSTLSTGDTAICRDSFRVALHAVGGVLKAVDAVMEGGIANAFCAIRPPGHHAGPGRGMGFCVFNNAAIAARHAQRSFGIQRVLIADWDVHHGNGTQDAFWEDNTVFFMSTHQWPLYPGTGAREETGAGKGKGFTMNRPFPPGSGNREIVGAFENDLLPAARKFRPELTIVSAGFDSRFDDPLGDFRIDDDGFRRLTRIMLEISRVAGNGRLVSVLEGGYNHDGLASAVDAHVGELLKG